MKRKQKILVSAVTALLGGSALSMSAMAYIDITGSTTTPTGTATYASEITGTLSYTLPLIKVNLGGPIGSDTAAIPAGETRYARIDLQNATFGTVAPNLGGLSSMTTGSTDNTVISGTASDCLPLTAQGETTVTDLLATNIQTAQAGGSGQNYVIFSVKAQATDTTGIYSSGCTIALNLHSINVVSAGQPVYMTYALYSGPIAAANNTISDTRGMNKSSIQIVNFAPALSFTTDSTAKDAIASVQQQFKLFKSGATNTSTDLRSASAGALTLTTNASVLTAAGVPISAVSDILDPTKAKLKVEGDFSSIWASGTDATAFLSDNAHCTSTSLALSSWDKNTSGVPIAANFTSVTALPSPAYFCLTLGSNNPNPIVSSGVQIAATSDSFKATLLALGNEVSTSYKVTDKQVTLKKIARDGVILESPFLNTAPGYTARVVLSHLNPTASEDVPYFITLRSDSGNTYLGDPNTKGILNGILKKGTTKKIMSTDIFKANTGMKNRVGLSITFYGQNDDIQGVVQHINTVTGEVTSIPMIRPGGGRNE
jgi:hypothetical protein